MTNIINRDYRSILAPILLGLIAFMLYAFLRSHDYLNVDGAIRCAEVWYRQEIFFHPSNHMLYPVNIFLWHKLLGLIGLKAVDTQSYLQLSQLMNGLFGAATLIVLYYLINIAIQSPLLSLILASGYGFSYAFIIHATNAAEPMVGLFWSTLALLVGYLAIKRASIWLALFTGLIYAISLATYQTMIIIAPVTLFLCWRSRSINKKFNRPAWEYILLMGLGGLSGLILIYGWYFYYLGINSIDGMLKTFFQLNGGDVYGGFEFYKFVNLPLAFFNNLVHVLPADFINIRTMLKIHQTDLVVPWILFIVTIFSIFFLLVSIAIWRVRDQISEDRKSILYAAILGFLLTIFPPIYWFPHYDKFWMQPLLFLFLALGICCHVLLINYQSRAILIYGGALLILVMFVNLKMINGYHTNATPYLIEAEQVAEILQPEDLIFIEWDGVSLTYLTFFTNSKKLQAETICFPSYGDIFGPEAINKLEAAINRAQARGGKIYFLGVLDISKMAWDLHLASKCKIPYNSLDQYRKQASILLKFEHKSFPVTLRRWWY